jgi:hypothetical protein
MVDWSDDVACGKLGRRVDRLPEPEALDHISDFAIALDRSRSELSSGSDAIHDTRSLAIVGDDRALIAIAVLQQLEGHCISVGATDTAWYESELILDFNSHT